MHVNKSAPPSFLLSDLKPEHLEHLKVGSTRVGAVIVAKSLISNVQNVFEFL